MDKIIELLSIISKDPDDIISSKVIDLVNNLFPTLKIKLLTKLSKRWTENVGEYMNKTNLVYGKMLWLLSGDKHYLSDVDTYVWKIEEDCERRNIFKELFVLIRENMYKIDERAAEQIIIQNYKTGTKYNKDLLSFILPTIRKEEKLRKGTEECTVEDQQEAIFGIRNSIKKYF